MQNFTITSDAKTVNNTYDVHQIDFALVQHCLDTMLHEGECQEGDEIIFKHEDGIMNIFFKDGGHLVTGNEDAELIQRVFDAREELEIYA